MIRLPQKDLLVLLFLLGKLLGTQVEHFDELDLIGIRERRQNSFAVYELTQLSHQIHALFPTQSLRF